MNDSYQAIYDAVRSRISGGNVSDAIRSVLRDSFDISRASECIVQEFCSYVSNVAYSMQRPSVLYRPTLSADGASWCALLGDNLQVGVAGFGDTPEQAMADFDRAFLNDRTPSAVFATMIGVA